MKNSIPKFITCSFLIFIPVVLGVAFLSSLSFSDPRDWYGGTCIKYYEGVNKGLVFERGEWHHYVEFMIDSNVSREFLRVIRAPLPSSISDHLSSGNLERVAYRWPSNWWDPFPARRWLICEVSY